MADRLTGGKLYDQGGYGCVFIPPLTCVPGSEIGEESQSGILEIDKLLSNSEAIIEYSIAEKIHRIPLWRNYYLVSTSMCTPAPRNQQTEPDLDKCKVLQGEDFSDFKLIRMPFGGRPLSQVSIKFSGKVMYDFIVHLLEGGALLQLFGIVHKDLHQGNILVDNVNVPRIIDFNLSLDTRMKITLSDLRHKISMGLFHESPDSCLVNAITQGKDGFTIIDRFINERKSLRKLQALLGITIEEMRDQLTYFYTHSKAAQEGDYVKWFYTYWPTIDSWSIGMNIVYLITDNMLWSDFRDSDYMSYGKKLLVIVRDMVNMNPMKRIDCVQALARLDTENYIIRKYAKKWLEKRPIIV
jgi:serine/threonine protein kinase